MLDRGAQFPSVLIESLIIHFFWMVAVLSSFMVHFRFCMMIDNRLCFHHVIVGHSSVFGLLVVLIGRK